MLIYLFAALVAALMVFVIPQPFGQFILFALVLGTLWHLSDRVDRLHAQLGGGSRPDDTPNDAAETERQRIRRKMAKYAEDANRKR